MDQIQLPPIDWTVIAQPALIFGWAMLVLMVDLFVPANNKRLTGILSLVGLLAAAGVGVALLRADDALTLTAANMIGLDNYALTFNWVFLAVAAITILISLDYLPRHGIERGEFYVLILFATGGMLLLSQGIDLIVLFLGLELLSITLYVLTGFAYRRLASEEAAMKYLLVGSFAAGFLVFGIALVFGATGSSNLVAISQALAGGQLAPAERSLLLVGIALVVIGFGYKIAMAPFHMWTPDVYEGSPTPVTAFMSVGTKSAGFAALARVLLSMPELRPNWLLILAVLAALTMLLGNIAAIAQTNVKRMLAYSSIGHAGFVLMGLLASNQRGVAGMLFYLVAYSLTNLAAFAVVIALERRGEAAWDMDDFAGLWSRQRWLAAAMAVCMFSLAGVPPTAGFIGKFYVFAAAWEAGLEWLVVVGVVASAVAAIFYMRIVAQMFMREPVRELRPAVGGPLALGLGIATTGVLLFGILPTPVITLVQQSVLALGR